MKLELNFIRMTQLLYNFGILLPKSAMVSYCSEISHIRSMLIASSPSKGLYYKNFKYS